MPVVGFQAAYFGLGLCSKGSLKILIRFFRILHKLHNLLLRFAWSLLRRQFRFGCGLFGFFLVGCHHLRTTGLVVIHHLAMQALDALVGVDVALGRNRLHRAFVITNLARIATH